MDRKRRFFARARSRPGEYCGLSYAWQALTLDARWRHIDGMKDAARLPGATGVMVYRGHGWP